MIEAVPELLAEGVKVAVRVRPEPLMGERVPPDTVMSPSAKPVGASEKVKVMVAVSPALRELTLLEMAMVGGVLSAGVITSLVTIGVAESVDGMTAKSPLANVLTPLTTPINVSSFAWTLSFWASFPL